MFSNKITIIIYKLSNTRFINISPPKAKHPVPWRRHYNWMSNSVNLFDISTKQYKLEDYRDETQIVPKDWFKK
jgi:hypothetical protein